VTIGYDAPWRQVHAMLLRAAAQVEGIRATPAPYVTQRALGDFYVEYESLVVVEWPGERVPVRTALLGKTRTCSTKTASRSCRRTFTTSLAKK